MPIISSRVIVVRMTLAALRAFVLIAVFGLLPRAPAGWAEDPLSSSCEKLKGGEAEWFLTEAKRPRGAAIVIHGLNNTPEIMNALIEYLNKQELHVLRIALSRKAALEEWRRQAEAAYCLSAGRFKGLPLYALGYSTGAALLIDFAAGSGPKKFKKMVLLAPPLRLRFTSKLLRPLTILRHLGLALPSFAPREYRASGTTPLQEYDNLFRLVESLERQRSSALKSASAIVLMSEEDELVSCRGVQRWLEEHEVDWKLTKLNPQPGNGGYDHMIVTPESLGKKEWQRVRQIISEFLADG